MRIGVNIPDELLQRVREIRPEVNVSQICRQALEDRAALAERVKAQVEEDGMGTHIQRFLGPNHAPLPEPDWVGHAMDDARSWVESVDPSEWHSLNGFYDRSADKENCIALIVEIGVAFSQRRRDHLDWCSQRYLRGDYGAHDEALSKYRNAWLAYYRDVRRREEQLMAERHQERMSELESGWKSRPEPDLPPHLRPPLDGEDVLSHPSRHVSRDLG